MRTGKVIVILLIAGFILGCNLGTFVESGDDLSTTAKTAKASTSLFDAEFTGDFWIAGGAGKSPIFFVDESGSGSEQTLGDFTYATSLLNSEARIPPGCGPGSSTGVGGSGVLDFGDGQIRLKRISGPACFDFPFVDIEEQWVIASGTGNYVGATGKLSRELVGDVLSGIAVGTISGTIKFHD